ncbi:hypothetical protein [Micromonospora antibiotica]|uniref:Uncharacterized protein n=1 Tax=Micromonospora antibiotica TaxID=2807623 RepID=A0ABS3V6P0_9ACTN|nr:hypothetical protein [Micromonospora antibiotica]MBO4161250.1 hypothetical protein [Micromonospora antibiotica]
MSGDPAYRQESKIGPRDADFGVRMAGVEDLVRINDENRHRGWSARWSSHDALRSEVAAGSTAILCPLFRNGGLLAESQSYRCHVFFASSRENRGLVSLIDVGKGTFENLREANSIENLTRVVRLLMDSYELTPLG